MVFQQDTQRGDGPVRTCVGCRRKAPKRELLRVVVRAGPDGQAPWHVEPDPDAARDPQEFMEMGGKGDEVLFEKSGSGSGSIYPNETIKAAAPEDGGQK